MFTKIWSDRWQAWDKRLHLQKKNIALLVDNCVVAHENVEGLICIKIGKLPSNITLLYQPCNVVIFRALKAYWVFHLNMSLYDNLYLNYCRRYENQTFFLKTNGLKLTQQKFELKIKEINVLINFLQMFNI